MSAPETFAEMEARLRLGEFRDSHACVRWKLNVPHSDGFADVKYFWSPGHLVDAKGRGFITQPAHTLCGKKVSDSCSVLPIYPNLRSLCPKCFAVAWETATLAFEMNSYE